MKSDFLQTFQHFLIDHVHTFVGLLSVSTTADEQNERGKRVENPYEV